MRHMLLTRHQTPAREGLIRGTSQSDHKKALTMHLASTADSSFRGRQEEGVIQGDTVLLIRDLRGHESLHLPKGPSRASRVLVAGVDPHTLLESSVTPQGPSWMARQEQN